MPSIFQQQFPTRDIRDIGLQGGNPAAFASLSGDLAKEAPNLDQSRAFGIALMGLLKQAQQFGTKPLEEQELNAREIQARRQAFTPPELIGAAPSVQAQARTAEAEALQPTITGARETKRTFGEQIKGFGDAITAARQFAADIVTEENRRRDDARSVIKDAFAIGGAEALKQLAPEEIQRLEKAAGYPKGYIHGVGQTLRERELQLRKELADLKPPTSAQETVSTYAARIEQSNPTINSLENSIKGMNFVNFEAQLRLPSILQNKTMQQYLQASRNFINSVLRRESGAVISPSEFSEARQQYLPQPGDTAEVLTQKRKNRQIVFETFKRGAGRAFQPLSELLKDNPNNWERIP